MQFSGYVKSRRGFLEHLLRGRVTVAEYTMHDIMQKLANPATGFLFGSAKFFAGNFDWSERQARRLLESLELKGYIGRFSTPGKRGNYPIGIDKYEVTVGARTGMRLVIEKTKDWRNPVYEGGEHAVKQAARSVSRSCPPKREGRIENTNPPTPLTGGNSQDPAKKNGSGKNSHLVWWGGQYILVTTDRRRLMTRTEKEALHGAHAKTVVEFFESRGMEARIIDNPEDYQ